MKYTVTHARCCELNCLDLVGLQSTRKSLCLFKADKGSFKWLCHRNGSTSKSSTCWSFLQHSWLWQMLFRCVRSHTSKCDSLILCSHENAKSECFNIKVFVALWYRFGLLFLMFTFVQPLTRNRAKSAIFNEIGLLKGLISEMAQSILLKCELSPRLMIPNNS